jgi:hypothetical protein
MTGTPTLSSKNTDTSTNSVSCAVSEHCVGRLAASPQMSVPALDCRMNKTYHAAFVLGGFVGVSVRQDRPQSRR